jgi:NodT family efflux transporter outer membrane factor (OMF) lipoprotein
MKRLFALAPLAALAACTVGPDYHGPESASSPVPPAAFVRGEGVGLPNQPQAAQWWTTLGDPLLDELEQRALAASPTIEIAQARIKQARASLREERANALPTANASALYLHADIPGTSLGQSESDNGERSSGGGSTALNLYNLGFDASWEVDLFGGKRRNTEAARATLGAAEANLADTQVTLTADVAQAYVNYRDRQQRIALGEEVIAKQRQMLALTQQRERGGTASQLDVERMRNLVEQSVAQFLPLKAERDAYLNALAVLAGEVPGTFDALLAQPRAIPLPPASVAVGDPAALLQRRPDIRKAERDLAAKTAKIGVAEAAKFPKISFMGMLGIGGTTPGDMFDLNNISAILAPQISWSFLDFGRNAARVHQAEGARDEAAAQYRGAVLDALKDAEDSLAKYGSQRQVVASAARTKSSANRAAMLMRQRLNAGTATLIDTLDTERQQAASEQALAQATAGMTNGYIALQKSLGLGWQDK